MPHVITTILLDDNPKGLKSIEMAGWMGQAFVVPRSTLPEFKKLEESKDPGLYFLFGEKDDAMFAYIGQGEEVVYRLLDHDSKRDEGEWNEALVFVGGLDSTYIKYLESMTFQLAEEAGRYKLYNKQAPRLNKLSRAQLISIDKYLRRITLIVGLFGYKIFEATPDQQNLVTYYLEDVHNKDAYATGAMLETGEFIMYAGSKFRTKLTQGLKNHGQSIISLREEMLKKGILEKYDNKSLLLKEDYIFSSPSRAATTAHGRGCNGWVCWKDSQGKTLDENYRA